MRVSCFFLLGVWVFFAWKFSGEVAWGCSKLCGDHAQLEMESAAEHAHSKFPPAPVYKEVDRQQEPLSAVALVTPVGQSVPPVLMHLTPASKRSGVDLAEQGGAEVQAHPDGMPRINSDLVPFDDQGPQEAAAGALRQRQ